MLDPLVADFLRLFQDPTLTLTNTSDLVRLFMTRIQGANKGHYDRPSSEQLAVGALAVLQSLLQTLPKNGIIVTENVTVDALIKHYKTWWEANIVFVE